MSTAPPPTKDRTPDQRAPEKSAADKVTSHEPNHLNGDAQPKSEPALVTGLIAVRIVLELVEATGSSPAHAILTLDNGARTIRVRLGSNNLLVSKAAARADTLNIRFFVGLALVQCCLHWTKKEDGKALYNELRTLAGYADRGYADLQSPDFSGRATISGHRYEVAARIHRAGTNELFLALTFYPQGRHD